MIDHILNNYTVNEKGCWVWNGTKNSKGYGIYCKGTSGKIIYVHVFVYKHFKGDIPNGLVLDHYICDNPPCCNPDHIKPEDKIYNMIRKRKNATHCNHGHEYTEENTAIYKGKRYCKQCDKDRKAVRSDRVVRKVIRGISK